ncbi:MAG: M2 family metallopeptidase [Gemmataceae bacterium]
MSPDRRSFLLAGGAAVAGLATPALAAPDDDAKKFIADHEARVKPLEIAAGHAWWRANISGRDDDFKKKEETQNAIDAALADRATFTRLRALKTARDANQIQDPILARQVELLYLAYLEKQVAPELLRRITGKANAVEQQFNVFRARVDGRELSDSDVRNVLKNSNDSAQRQAVWEASKRVGAVVESDLKELVGLRNEAAKALGFANYHALQLKLSEQDGTELIKLFDDLDTLTKGPFEAAKAEIDERLAKRYGVAVNALQAWHYHDPFFQESPTVFEANLDAPFVRADIVKLCSDFYKGIGLPIDDVIARSDLQEKPGKSPHAFCTDIDREGSEVRVLANIQPNEYWMGTMLHELGHAVYSSKNIPNKLPYVLRAEAHILSTEGVAMQFERFSKSRAWIEKMGIPLATPVAFEEAANRTRRNQLLIFSRWCQVMLRFEKGMYENPAQDLNKLWWDLVERYQGVKKPAGRNAPDYASKIHICSAPVYYHNYMMGQLFASQVHHAIARDVYKEPDPKKVIYVGDLRVGQFMKEKVFAPGRTLDWKGLTRFATGAELTPAAFARDFEGR